MQPVVPLPSAGIHRRRIKAALSIGVRAVIALAARLSRVGMSGPPIDPQLWPFHDPPHSILLVRFDLIGDTVMSLPLARDLKLIFPEAELTFLTTPASSQIVAMSPHVDHCLTADMPSLTHLQAASAVGVWTSALSLIRTIRKKQFDLAISAYGPLAGAVVGLSAAIWRAGYKSEAPGGCFDFPITGTRRPGTKHEIDWGRNIAGHAKQALPPGLLLVPNWAKQRIVEMLPQGSDPLIVIHTGANNGTAKIWPSTRWQSLITMILEETEARLVAVGDQAQQQVTRDIFGDSERSRDLTGQTTITELAAVISDCDVLVSGDSGPLHLATALGKRVVGIYGPTDPNLSGPFAGDSRIVTAGIPCSPCYDLQVPADCPFGDSLCMDWIQPEKVFETVLGQIGTTTKK